MPATRGSLAETDRPTQRARVIPELLSERAAETPDVLVLRVDGGETLTYRQWDRRSNGVARGLQDAGVERGDRVGLLYCGLAWVDYFVAYMGVVKAGAAALHLNEDIDSSEQLRRLHQVGAVGVIQGSDIEVPDDFAGWRCTVADLASADESPPDVTIGADDLASILYTSGTTGPAKALAVPHGNITYRRSIDNFAVLGDPRPVIVPMPVSSTPSFTSSALALTSASTLIVCSRDDPDRMAHLIDRFDVTSLMLTPYIAMRLIDARVGERHDLSRVKTVATASAPFPPSLVAPLAATFPHAALRMAYSAAETYTALMQADLGLEPSTSVGTPAPGSRVRVTDRDRNEVPPGVLGDIWLGSDSPKRYYLDNPEMNAETYDGSWTKTGDLGYIGEGGELHLFDRKRDAISIGDALVSTIEVESMLYRHPAVKEAAVVAIPDTGTETARVGAALVLREDRLDDVVAFAASSLAPHEQPQEYVVFDSFPRTTNGKILKRELLEAFAP